MHPTSTRTRVRDYCTSRITMIYSVQSTVASHQVEVRASSEDGGKADSGANLPQMRCRPPTGRPQDVFQCVGVVCVRGGGAKSSSKSVLMSSSASKRHIGGNVAAGISGGEGADIEDDA